MTAFTRLAATAIVLFTAVYASAVDGATIAGSIENSNRADENRERDEARAVNRHVLDDYERPARFEHAREFGEQCGRVYREVFT